MPVPFLDLSRQYNELETEIAPALSRVISSGNYILGCEVDAFEKEWARFCRARGAAAVGNGTDALTLTLIASGAVRRGQRDEVITSTLTAAYTALAILNAGGVPVFADIDPETYTLDPHSVEQAITPRTRAIVPVHLYGQLANIRAICEIAGRFDLAVIEDAAQSHGARLDTGVEGICSVAAAYSFYPTKNLGAFGDGGAVVSNDLTLIEKVKILRQGGHAPALKERLEGRNSRLDEMQAALLRVKLRHLDKWNRRRRECAAIYNAGLEGRNARIKVPTLVAPEMHAFHLYVIQHPSRDALRSHLSQQGVETMIHYPYPLHLQPLFRREEQGRLPIAEQVVGRILSLPLYPQLESEEARTVVDALLDFKYRE